MGDIRNKIAKIERAKADKAAMESFLRAAGWKPSPPETPSHMLAFVCTGCLHNHSEKPIYSCQRGHWDPVEYWCLDCMPPHLRAFYRLSGNHTATP